ncbi:MAG: hypothetical protein IKD21_01880 [Clostridia bacterium]|nr:hypothetical protein [Clostridia bacterium]
MKYLIGLDIGTSSVKGVLMTTEGDVIKTARCGFSYTKLEGGGLEIAAEDFTSVCVRTIKELAQGAAGDICGICAASASGNLLVLDEENKPATPIFNWQDSRVTTEATEVLGELDTDALYRRTGWPFDYTTFPLALLCYVKKHEPQKLKNCGKVCMSTEYLYYCLTGKWGISTSAGTPFYLIDQQTGQYIPELLNALEITEEQLPPVLPCGSVLGGTLPEMEKACGLPAGTPVVLGSFDHPSAARGVGVLNEGEMLLSCGTSWVGFFPIKDREKAASAKALIDPFLAPVGGCWATMVSVSSLSERIQLYTNRYIDDSDKAFQILADLAAKSKAGANGLSLCLTEDPDDANVLKYEKTDIARAIMEGTVLLLKAKLDNLAQVGIKATSAVMVGGPSENPMWLRLIEEICGITGKTIHGSSAGAVGAAMMAGIGTGIYRNEAEANAICNKKE